MKPYIQLTQGRIEPNKFADQPPLSPPYNNLANYIELPEEFANQNKLCFVTSHQVFKICFVTEHTQF